MILCAVNFRASTTRFSITFSNESDIIAISRFSMTMTTRNGNTTKHAVASPFV